VSPGVLQHRIVLRDAVVAGVERALALHAGTARRFAAIAHRVPDHRLTRSVRDYLDKTPRRLAAERAEAGSPAYDREATRAEQVDARVCGMLHHACYRGEVHRLATMVGEAALAAEIHEELAALSDEIVGESALLVLPLRPLVATQAGAGLLAIDAVRASPRR